MTPNAKKWAGLFIILLLTAATYSNTLDAEFHLDDTDAILGNSKIHLNSLSIEGIKQVVSQSRPVAHLSLALNYYIGEFDVAGYHLVNIILHLLTAGLLYWLILTTLRLPAFKDRYNQSAQRIAFSGTLLWAAHPVQTQAVTYIVQRMAVMAGLFSIASILCYVLGRQTIGTSRFVWYGASLIALSLGLGSKQTAATVPIFIVLYEILLISRLNPRLMMRALAYPFVLFLMVTVYVGLYYLDWSLGIWEAFRKLFASSYMASAYDVTFAERFFTQSRIIVYYLSLIFYPNPSRLNFDYDYPVSQSIWDPPTTFFSLLFLAGTLFYALRLARQKPLISYCILWFYGNLVIESFLFHLDLVFEHRLYLPSMGIILLTVGVIDHVWSKYSIGVNRLGKRIIIGAGIGAVALICLWTYQRNETWRTDLALWEDTVKKSPNKPRARNYLGYALIRKGRWKDAALQYEEAMEANIEVYGLTINLAGVLAKEGEIGKAIKVLEETLVEHPNGLLGHYNLGNLYIEAGHPDLAIKAYKQALEVNPDFIPAYAQLGRTLENSGQITEAALIYEDAVRRDPFIDQSYSGLGRIRMKLGDLEGAQESYEKAIRLNPENFDTHYNLGWIYHQQGRFDRAEREYMESLRQNPAHPQARNNLGILYIMKGRLNHGILELQKAVERKEDYVEARYNLAKALRLAGNQEAAIREYNKVLENVPQHDLNPYREKAQSELRALLSQKSTKLPSTK